jgi:quaternary ammonium compound-resistance protein SugE
MNSSWIYLLLATVAEVLYGIGLYHSRGFTQPWPSLLALVAGVVTTLLLGLALKHLPIGLSIAVWGGLACVGTTTYGIICLGETRDLAQLGLMALIVVCTVGLKITSSH